jgi:hypothetical protein
VQGALKLGVTIALSVGIGVLVYRLLENHRQATLLRDVDAAEHRVVALSTSALRNASLSDQERAQLIERLTAMQTEAQVHARQIDIPSQSLVVLALFACVSVLVTGYLVSEQGARKRRRAAFMLDRVHACAARFTDATSFVIESNKLTVVRSLDNASLEDLCDLRVALAKLLARSEATLEVDASAIESPSSQMLGAFAEATLEAHGAGKTLNVKVSQRFMELATLAGLNALARLEVKKAESAQGPDY